MTFEQQLKQISDILNNQIKASTDSAEIDGLIALRREVLQLTKKVTGENINRATAEYNAFSAALEKASETLQKESDEIENIAKWIKRTGKAISKVCELAAKVF
jgi:hypothetical protein